MSAILRPASRRLVLRRAPSLLAALAGLGASRPPSPPLPRGGPVVRTRAGQLAGEQQAGLRRWLGVPYGVVPGRFLAPAPPASWSGVKTALVFGPVAPQPLARDDEVVSSEQCLSLNVWSPAHAEGLPVLVWLHGGANVSGASSQPIFDGEHFARTGVVCVTLNYRLGLLGFLELGARLGPSYRGSGNNGLLDQLLALRWVRDNIAAFGGDPAQVTLAGQSAGAKDVAALLAAPAAHGLFRRAILESGGGRTVLSLAQAERVAETVLDLLDLSPDEAARLVDMPLKRLLAAQQRLMRASPFGYPLRPVLDGRLLFDMPEEAVAMGAAMRVPLLLGTNRDESRLFLGHLAASLPLPGHDLSNMPADAFERMMLRYRAAGQEAVAGPDGLAEARWRALTAEEYWIPQVRLAEAQSAAGGLVWMYRFDKPADAGPFRGRAAHVSELPYVWDNPDDPDLRPLIEGFDPQLAARMHHAWTSFIAGGAPAAPGLPDWPAYDTRRRPTMILDRTSRVVDDPWPDDRRRWTRLFLAGEEQPDP